MNKKTIKFAGLALGMAMAIAGIGAAISASRGVTEAKATDAVYYTLTPEAGGDNAYAGAGSIEIDPQTTDACETAISWNVTGNSTMTPWRIGGKNLSNVNRAIYSETAMPATITSVKMTLGNASSITINSCSFVVASDSSFKSIVDTVNVGNSIDNKVTTISPSKDVVWAAGSYYKFTFNVSVSGSSNKYIEFSGAEFYYEDSPDLEVSSVDKTTDPTKVEYKLGESFDPTGLKVTVTYSDDSTSEVAYSSENASAFEFTGFDSSAAAEDQEVTVKYTVGETQYTCATKVVVDVINVVPNAILVDPTTVKVDYTVGEKLDLSGLSIDVGYTDDSDEPITIVDNADFIAKGFSLTLNDAAFDLDTTLSVDHNGASFVVHLGELDDSSDPIEINVVEVQKYTLATSITQLTVGNKVVIAAVSGGKTYVAKAYEGTNNNVKAVAATLSDGKIVKTDSFSAYTIGADQNGLTLRDESGNYLYAAGGTSNNYLKGEDSPSLAGHWNIAISGGSFSVVSAKTETNFRGTMQYNANNTLFACYASASQTALKLYVLDTNPSDADKVETFSQLYMHKADIDHADTKTHKSATDTCVAYFDAAKAALDGDWSDIAAAFAGSGDMWDRFVSWGAAKGTTVSYNDAIVYNAATIIRGGSFNNSALIIASVLAVGAISAGALVLLRRRKEN